MKTISTLEQFGFTKKQIQFYEAALEYGEAPISLIAKHAKITRTTAYHTVKELENEEYMDELRESTLSDAGRNEWCGY